MHDALGVASARESSAVIRPSCITSTRSAMPSTSGSSEEIITMATPRPARSERSRCTSDLVPMSMPRVGSSTISRVGSVASHLASTTFCWLPPDMVAAACCGEPVLTWSLRDQSSAARASARLLIRPNRETCERRVRVRLRATDSSMTRPCLRRSSGTKAMPAAMAACGDRGATSAPFIRTLPLS